MNHFLKMPEQRDSTPTKPEKRTGRQLSHGKETRKNRFRKSRNHLKRNGCKRNAG